MKLSDFTQGRDNNFNLIRIVAAFTVLVTHSFALAMGMGDVEPLRHTLGKTIGAIAVDIFFVTSGFLVTASLLARKSTIEFLWARVLRIFPALIAMLLLTVFGLGLTFTTFSWYEYFAQRQTWKFLLKCGTLFTGAAYELPGVFESNPYKNTVNGSLWTMPYEVNMYALLAVIWAGLRVMPRLRTRAFKCAVCACAVVAGVLVVVVHMTMAKDYPFMWLFFMFFTGASFFILKDRIILSHSMFCLCVAILILAIPYKQVCFVAYVSTIAYILFYLAYIPRGFIRQYNRIGDYSYGIYIYAFPVQQSIAALIPGISVLSMLVVSGGITLVLAALSWHLVERNTLRLKGQYVEFTRQVLACGGRLRRSVTRL